MEKLTVMAKFKGRRGALPLESIIDTGASITAISKSIADAIGVRYRGDTLSIEVANGKRFRCPVAKVILSIPHLRCSASMDVAVVNAMIPPLIGSDFLQKKRMLVDYRDHSIRYKGKKHKLVYIFYWVLC